MLASIMEIMMKVSVMLVVAVVSVSAGLKTYENIVPGYMQATPPSAMCTPKYLNDSYGLILSHEGADQMPYADNLDCQFTLNTTRGRRINLRFEFFDMEPNYNRDTGRCRDSGDRLAIYESGERFLIGNDDLQPERTLCGGTGSFPEDYQSVGHIITVRLITDRKSSDNKGLQFLFSSFLSPEEGGDDCFVCEDGSMCLDKSLQCDGITQCNDDSDELAASCAQLNIWNELVAEYGFTVVVVVAAAAVVAVVLILVFCICCCCCCCCGRRKKANLQEQKQYQRPPNGGGPRPAAAASAPYPPPQNMPASNYPSYNSSIPNHGRPQPGHPGGYHTPGYTPNGHAGYQAVYNPANNINSRVPYPHQV